MNLDFSATLSTLGKLATPHGIKVVYGCGCECLMMLDFAFYKFRL
jgi:hypothetical protein